MIIQRTWDIYVGYYDFNTTGGAIGSYDLLVPVPLNCVVHSFGAVCVTPLASAGSATISFDAIYKQTTGIPNIGFFCQAVAYTQLSATGAVYNGVQAAPNHGLNTAGNGGKILTYPVSVGMSIAGAALTAGQLQFYIMGITFDF